MRYRCPPGRLGRLVLSLPPLATLVAGGCGRNHGADVVVYCSMDRPLAEPIFADFTGKTGIQVRPLWDTEADKTTGLAGRLLAESPSPRADVFWSSELVQTAALAEQGVFETHRSPAAADLPDWARDPQGRWTAFAGRGRVVLANRKRVGAGVGLSSLDDLDDLADPAWKGQAGLALPLFGTTATHLAWIVATRGEEATARLLAGIRANGALVAGGNADVKNRVVSGELAWGFVDTDDALAAVASGADVEVLYPGAAEGGAGMLLVPSTVAVVKGAPHPAAARRLADHLLSADTEQALANGSTAAWPLRPGLAGPPGAPALSTLRVATPDAAALVRALPPATRLARETFLR